MSSSTVTAGGSFSPFLHYPPLGHTTTSLSKPHWLSQWEFPPLWPVPDVIIAVCLLVGCLMSQQHASVSQGCCPCKSGVRNHAVSNNTCCHKKALHRTYCWEALYWQGETDTLCSPVHSAAGSSACKQWWLKARGDKQPDAQPHTLRKIPSSNPACGRIFPGSSHTSDLKIGTPVATLPGAWRYGVSAGTGWPSVIILWLGEMESWIYNFYLSVAARKIVWADPSLRYTCMLLGR